MSERLKIVEEWPRLHPVLEKYLAETQDLRSAPANVQNQEDGVLVFRTLDGSRIRPLREAVVQEEFERTKENLDRGEIEGLLIAGRWFVRVEGDN